MLNHTLTRAEGAGKVTRRSRSRDEGDIRRSPFLTAPFTKIVRAFGAERILKLHLKIKELALTVGQSRQKCKQQVQSKVTDLSTTCKIKSLVCGLEPDFPPTKGKV